MITLPSVESTKASVSIVTLLPISRLLIENLANALGPIVIPWGILKFSSSRTSVAPLLANPGQNALLPILVMVSEISMLDISSKYSFHGAVDS